MHRSAAAGPDAAKAYTNGQVNKADPLHLVVQLYDGAIGNILRARELQERRDRPGTHRHLGKALAIVGELQAVLDLEKGQEIALNLDRLYHFFRRRLLDAQIRPRPDVLDEVVELMRPLRDAWSEAWEKQSRERR